MKKTFPLEAVLQKKVIKELKLLENTWFEKIADRAKRGLPDIIACINGHFIALELKRDESIGATPLQKEILSRISNACGMVWVVNPQNWPSVLDRLKDLSK